MRSAVPILDSAGRLLGSGALVAPRLVVTCRHVVDKHLPDGSWSGEYGDAELSAGGIGCEEVRRSPPHGQPPSAAAHDDLAVLRLAGDVPGAPVPVVVGAVAASLYCGARLVGFHGDPSPPGYRRGDVTFAPSVSGLVETDIVGFTSATVREGMSGGPVLVDYNGTPVCLGVARLGGLGRASSVVTTGLAIHAFAESLDANARAWWQDVRFRPLLREEIETYLSRVDADTASLPSFYPEALRASGSGARPFERIRQRVRVLERESFNAWRAEQPDRELRRAAADAAAFDPAIYDPWRSLPSDAEGDEGGGKRRARMNAFVWDDLADSPAFAHVVILGDPGFGKTWLLRHEARRHLEACRLRLSTAQPFATPDDLPLPVWVRLPDLARVEALTFADGLRKCFEQALDPPTLSARLLEQAERGSLVLLLDAWDEVISDADSLRANIEAFARRSKCRIVFVSRGARFRTSPLPDAPVLEIMAFERPEIEAFTHVWFGNDTDRADAFLRTLDQAAVGGLARIPLLLAFLCRVFEHASHALPVNRGELYRKCLSGLLRDWKDADRKQVLSDEMIVARVAELARAAAELFPREHFSTEDLAKAAGYSLETYADRQEGAGFVEALKDDGLLIPVGPRDAGWQLLHRTLYEWLVAHAMATRVRQQGWDSVAARVDDHSHNPLWREVVVLMAGELDDPTPLLTRLADIRADDMFRPRLALAVRCLPEIAPAVRRTLEVTQVVDAITTAAMDAWYGLGTRHVSAAAPALKESLPSLAVANGRWGDAPLLARLAREIASAEENAVGSASFGVYHLGPAAASTEILAALLSLLRGPNHPNRIRAVELFNTFGSAAVTPGVRVALVAALASTDSGLRELAAVVIGSLGPRMAQPDVLAALDVCLEDPNVPVSVSAMDAISDLGRDAVTPRYADRLVRFIVEGIHPGLVFAAQYSLETICAIAVPRGLSKWCLERLGDPAPSVRRDAFSVVSFLGAAVVHDDVFNAVIGCLADSDPSVRKEAMNSIAWFGPPANTAPVRDALVQRLADEEVDQRVAAATALDRLGKRIADPMVTAALITALSDADASVRERSARALGRWTSNTDDGRAGALVDLLARDDAWRVRAAAAESLGQSASNSDAIIVDALVKSCSDEHIEVRTAAIEALGSIGPSAATPSVVHALTDLLPTDERLPVWWAVLQSLGDFGPAAATERRIHLLVDVLTKAPEVDAYSGVVRTLARWGPVAATPQVLDALLARVCKAEKDRMRRIAGESLVQLGLLEHTEYVIKRLITLLDDRYSGTRKVAALIVGDFQRRGIRVPSAPDAPRRTSARRPPRRGGSRRAKRR